MNQEPWVSVWKVNRGWLAKVGCQYFVFGVSEKNEMADAFRELIIGGEQEARKRWCEKDSEVEATREPVNPSVVNRRAI